MRCRGESIRGWVDHAVQLYTQIYLDPEQGLRGPRTKPAQSWLGVRSNPAQGSLVVCRVYLQGLNLVYLDHVSIFSPN